MDEGKPFGVAHIGSVQASDFSEDDLMLFRMLVERASSVIVRAQLVDVLERTAHFREQFIGVLGHDLRSPLNAVMGTAQLLLAADDLPPDRVRSAHQRILRSATRMNGLINDILDFTRVRLGGGFTLRRERIRVTKLVQDVVEELAPSAGRRTITVDGDDSVCATGDRERVIQALTNLLANAIQHSADGSEVRVTVRRSDTSSAVIDVWNSGPPIPPEVLRSLFEPFARSDDSRGLGLGLFIVSAIARAHDGSASVSSDDDGTTFSMSLPADESRA
jgi:signal transduction histidine kinase